MAQSVKSNIVKLYLIKIAKWFMLFMPIIVLFYQDNGLAMQDIFTLKAVYSIAIVVLEIPSGYLADVLGRKKTLIIGTILGFLGFVVYDFSFSFWGFLMAELVLGLGQSLISGADSALLYDSLKAMGNQKKYLKYEGRMVSIGNFAEAIAGILGGLLAEISLRTPFYGQTAIAFIGIPAAILLVEPVRYQKISRMRMIDILGIVKYSLFKSGHLKWTIFYSAIIGTTTLTMAWFVQPYFKMVELPLAMFGVFWALLNLSVGITSYYAHKLEFSLGQYKTMLLITIMIPGLYIVLSQINALWGIAILFIFYLVRGFATPILKDYINKLTESNIRATVLSVRNFMIRIVFAGIGPFLGWYTDIFSLSSALLLAGITYLTIAAIFLVFFLKTREITY
jgi:MFS family permease